jgi:hypothetical protein
MQIRLVLTKKDQFEAFWSKWDLSKNGNFFWFITFDPFNRFSKF